jgi:hypothetical protein
MVLIFVGEDLFCNTYVVDVALALQYQFPGSKYTHSSCPCPWGRLKMAKNHYILMTSPIFKMIILILIYIYKFKTHMPQWNWVKSQ